ncbi:MAG: efflux RND transporter periplasmic adaptor subunit [Proteobacteria bacterium]|nr:efflux RND transporter periplasmic adaptor subunit [Pseudomonadota bacterium]
MEMTRFATCWLACAILGAAAPIAHAEEDAAQPAVATVRVAPATLAPMRQSLTAYGTVDFSADALQPLSVPYQARVVRVAVVAGQAVHKGDALIVLAPTAASTLELQRAGNDAQFARKELARTQQLFAQHLATNTDLATAEQAAHNADAALASATARFGGGGERTLRAAHDGVVADLAAHAGEVIAADTEFAHVGDTSGLRLDLGVEPAAIAQVRVGAVVKFHLLQDGASERQASVERVGSQVDAQTRLIPVVAKLADSAQVPPGVAVSAQIETGSGKPVLGVPRSAVLWEGARAYVFVVQAGKAARRFVDTGEDDGERIEIRSGLAANESVVVLGNHELQDGMAVKVQ